MLFAILSLVALLWLVISAVGTLVSSIRPSALWHVRFSGFLLIASFFALAITTPAKNEAKIGVTEAKDSGLSQSSQKNAEARELTETAAKIKKAGEETAARLERTQTERAQLAHWDVSEGKSKLDDSKTVRIDTKSIQMRLNRYGQFRPLILTIICAENRTKTYISFAEHFMSDIQGKGRVDYRVDDKPAKHRNFRESNDHSVLGLWSGGASIPWLRELFGAKRLYVRATPFSESTVDGEFNVEGIEKVIMPLRKACNW